MQLDCCGVNDRSDWNFSPYVNLTGLYPNTCCASQVNCGPISSHDLDCINATQTFVSENATAIGGVGIAFALVEILGILLAVLLCLCIHIENILTSGMPRKKQDLKSEEKE